MHFVCHLSCNRLCICYQVYIYSSGRQLVQRLIFGYRKYGYLRKYLCGEFVTRVG
ncbi:putative HAD superfamily protein [Helianthus debilis subsp. tardiflorus]